jgi:7-keto-8-aminopelargonate synthetase-like enzyme
VTLSKAAGAFGAYCCGSENLISFLINHARSFIYTTGLPPSVAQAACGAVEIIQNEPQRRHTLWNWTTLMHQELKRMRFDTLDSQTPIIPILVKDAPLAVEFSQMLFEKGIFVQAIRPPTVPQNTARLRLTVMATHHREDLECALEALQEIGRRLCLI